MDVKLGTQLGIQFKNILPTIVKLYTPILFLLFLVVLASLKTGIPILNFTKDTISMTDMPPFFGVVSNIGILLWCASASICFLMSAIIRKYNQHISVYKRRELSIFFLCSGVITSILLLDDLFLLHEVIFPDYLNIPEKITYISYIIMIFLYLFRFRKTIIRIITEGILLCFAFLFFGLSIGMDMLPITMDINVEYLFEDGFKLLGIVSWLGYFFRVSLKVLLDKL